MPFDPDKYLATKKEAPKSGFDPDKYLASKLGASPAPAASSDNSTLLTLAAPIATEKGREFLRGVGGVGYGVASGLNPLTIPHSLGTLKRAVFNETGGPLERLQKGSENTSIPELSFDQIAAGARATGRTLGGESFSKAYPEEMTKQREAMNAFFPENSREVGEIGVGLAALAKGALDVGRLAKGAAATLGLTGKIASKAEKLAVDSLKPTQRAANILLKNKKTNPVGRELLDQKIVTPGASYSTMLQKTDQKLSDLGETIGHFSKKADEAVARDSAIRKVRVDDVADLVKRTVLPDLEERGAGRSADEVLKWLSSDLSRASKDGELGFEQLQKIKTTLGKARSRFDKLLDTDTGDAFQDVYAIVNEIHTRGIEDALKAAKHTEGIDEFKKAKKAFSNLQSAKKILDRTVSGAGTANKKISLTDVITGSAGSTAGAAALGAPGMAVGIPVAIANRLARTRGLQTASSLLDVISKPGPKGSVKPDWSKIGALNLLTSQQGEQ